MSVRESVQAIASAQRWIFFSPKDQRHIASFCIGCSFHAETNEDECVSRLVRSPAAAALFHDFGNTEQLNRTGTVLVRFVGTEQASHGN